MWCGECSSSIKRTGRSRRLEVERDTTAGGASKNNTHHHCQIYHVAAQVYPLLELHFRLDLLLDPLACAEGGELSLRML